jgi:predicted nucleic acid-binding protein
MIVVSNASPLVGLASIRQFDLLNQLYGDEGESEAIALAVELEAELLVIDERLGRDTARHFGLNFTGLIGLLVDAKHKGLIDEIKRYLDELRNVFGFRISESLYRRVLTDEGEWP